MKKFYKRRLFQNVVEIYIAYIAHFLLPTKNYDENIKWFLNQKHYFNNGLDIDLIVLK